MAEQTVWLRDGKLLVKSKEGKEVYICDACPCDTGGRFWVLPCMEANYMPGCVGVVAKGPFRSFFSSLKFKMTDDPELFDNAPGVVVYEYLGKDKKRTFIGEPWVELYIEDVIEELTDIA